MAKNWKSATVYPPRYFLGHLDVEIKRRGVRVEFYNAPIVPMSRHRAVIFCGGEGSCFYEDAAHEFSDLNRARLIAIQYAISVYDGRTRSYRVEKFNHPFDRDTRVFHRGDRLEIMRPDRGPIYGVYAVDEVLDGVSRCDVPVTQFIS